MARATTLNAIIGNTVNDYKLSAADKATILKALLSAPYLVPSGTRTPVAVLFSNN